jgi:transaldolase
MNSLLTLRNCGQRIWLDNLSRTLLYEGGLRRLIDEDGVAGVTSNPTIFYKAISESPYYRSDLGALKREAQLSAEERYERLAIPDIQAACDLLRPVFDSSGGEDATGLEVSPALAHDANGTTRRVDCAAVNRQSARHVPERQRARAAAELIGQDSINVTLMFHWHSRRCRRASAASRVGSCSGDPRKSSPSQACP